MKIQDLKYETYYEFGGYPFRLLDSPDVIYEAVYTDNGVEYCKAAVSDNPYWDYENRRNGRGTSTGIPVQFCEFDSDGTVLDWSNRDGDVYLGGERNYATVTVNVNGIAMFPKDTEFQVIGTWDQYLEVHAERIKRRFDQIERERAEAEERQKELAARAKIDAQCEEDRAAIRRLLGILFGLYSISNYNLPESQVGRARQLLEKHEEVRKNNMELFTITSTVELDSEDDEAEPSFTVENELVVILDEDEDDFEFEDDEDDDEEDEDDEDDFQNRQDTLADQRRLSDNIG